MEKEKIIELAIDIAEKSGCDVSGMDGREYESMWCGRKEFENFVIDFACQLKIIGIEK